MAEAGIELSPDSPCKTATRPAGAAESAAVPISCEAFDPHQPEAISDWLSVCPIGLSAAQVGQIKQVLCESSEPGVPSPDPTAG